MTAAPQPAPAGSNVVELLRGVAARVPERPALVFGGGRAPARRVSFAELWRQTGAVAAGLAEEGLAPGDRAIVMIPMSPELYAVLLGVLRLGAVAVFVDPWIGGRQIADFAAFAEPRAFLGVGRSHLLRLLDRRLRRLPVTVTTGRRLGPLPARRTLTEIARRAENAETDRVPVHPAGPDDPALITFTSGSSGTPKGADRTHGYLVAQHRALRAELPYRDDDVDLPMFPVFALNNLALGIPSVIPEMDFRRVDAVDPGPVLSQIERHGVTTATASPPFFDRLADQIEAVGAGGRPAPRLRRILTGGAPVSDAQLRRWRRVFPDTEIVVVYGSTEAEPVAHLPADERLAAGEAGGLGVCAGPPSDRLERRIVRIERGPIDLAAGGWAAWELPPGAVGELVVSGEHVCRGYFRAPEADRANKIAEPSGKVWHRMGDTGYLDAEGRFWLVGRVHSTILRRGEPVHPLPVEQAALGDDPRVRRAAAVGLADPELGERVVVVVEAAPGEAEAVRAAVSERLAAAGYPVDEVVVTGRPLPLDPRHRSKVDVGRLRRLVECGALGGSGR